MKQIEKSIYKNLKRWYNKSVERGWKCKVLDKIAKVAGIVVAILESVKILLELFER